MTPRTAVLAHAARLARHAPSILNTQPWQWRIGRHTAELRPDPSRTLPLTDPDDHLTLLSCGAALHHAIVAVHSLGWDVTVTLPGTGPLSAADREATGEAAGNDNAVLACLTLGGPSEQRDTDLAAAITHRRTDRRAFGAQPPDDETIADLRRVVAAHGISAHLVRRDEIPLLAAATTRAASDAAHRPGHIAEIAHWASGGSSAGGIRPVPMRALHGPATGDGDIGARYLVLYGTGDTTADWLRAGLALSHLLLAATVRGIACSPMSELVEAPWPRGLLATLVGKACHPYLVIRFGYPLNDEPPPATPRRPETETTSYLFPAIPGSSTHPTPPWPS